MILAEDILIGTWLRGEHLDDLPHVEPKYFEYASVVRELKNGIPTMRVLSNSKDRVKLIEMTTMSTPSLYESAYMSLIEFQIREAIKGETDLDHISEMLSHRSTRFAKPIQGFTDYAKSFADEMARREHQETIKWVDMPSLQEMTLGIKRKELTAIAARPSVGKSAFALQVAFGAWRQGAKVLYFPLEMSAQQTLGRILIREGYISPKENQSGVIKDQDKYQLGIDLLNKVESSGRFLIYEGEGRIEEIEKLIEAEEPYLVVIDQLTQMKASQQFKDLRSQFSYMTSNLKRIAMQHDVAVALLCQINRNADNIKPTMANLKESGSIEEDSDNVLLMHRFQKGDDEMKEYGFNDWNNIRPMEFNLAKQRDGETGSFNVEFRPSLMRFYEAYQGGASYV